MINKINYTIKKTSMEDVLKYYNPILINKFCEGCNKYKALWSCPPLPFKDLDYLKDFKYCYLISGKVFINSFSSEELTAIITEALNKYDDLNSSKDENSKIFNGLYHSFRELNDDKIRSLESTFPSSIALISGRCLLCPSCTRPKNLPCAFPQSLRYSLEALGLDVSAILENLLFEKIQWSSEKSPEYVTCVSALLSNEDIEEKQIKHLIEP